MPRRLNPWDSLMVCGYSWTVAERIVRAWAKSEGIRVVQPNTRGTSRLGPPPNHPAWQAKTPKVEDK